MAADSPDLESQVFVKTGLYSAVAAHLVKRGDELTLTAAETEVFRAPLSQVGVEFPRRWFGGGMRLAVGGQVYTVGFAPPAKVEGAVEDPDLLSGDIVIQQRKRWNATRQSSRRWRTALLGRPR